jgi:hypothetical protein
MIRYISLVLGLMIFAAPVSFAEDQSRSILAASVNWDDAASREKMLENVPKWQYPIIESMFSAYLHPERYQLPLYKDERSFNLQFINAFWGPVDNPFSKYQRPAKVFAFVGDKSIFYMAPLIQDEADGNYYVFDKIQMRPMLLSSWIAVIQNTHGPSFRIHFSVCNGYGAFPSDTCRDRSYQNEIADIKPKTANDLKTMSTPILIPSAHRDSHEDWRTKINSDHLVGAMDNNTLNIYKSSAAWSNETARKKLLNTVATWADFKTIQSNFEKIRDIRYFHDTKQVGFLRRISWLYPDDGCWTRASAVIKDLFGPISNIANQFSRPSKIFAFGNLCANTPNSPDGKVTWWYHTAPIIRDKQTNQSYVLDPSIDAKKPLAVEKWIEAISTGDGACKEEFASVNRFNICDGYGTGPYSSCHEPSRVDFATESTAVLGQPNYQVYERQRQVRLGRDPDVVLGVMPPWEMA